MFCTFIAVSTVIWFIIVVVVFLVLSQLDSYVVITALSQIFAALGTILYPVFFEVYFLFDQKDIMDPDAIVYLKPIKFIKFKC